MVEYSIYGSKHWDGAGSEYTITPFLHHSRPVSPRLHALYYSDTCIRAPETHKRMFFLPPPCFCSLYPSLITFPPASLPQPRSHLRNPEEIQEYRRDFLIKTMFPQIPLLVHVLLPCSSVPTPCLKQRMGEERVEGCNSSEHKVTVQKWTALNGESGVGER